MVGTRVLGSDAAVAVGRFNPAGPDGYRARTAPDAPLRRTRVEAEADERHHLDGLTLQTCRHCQAIIDWSAGSRAWLEHRSRWTQRSLSRLLCDRSPAGLHEPVTP